MKRARPIVVVIVRDKFYLVDGFHRLKKVIKAGSAEISAIVYKEKM